MIRVHSITHEGHGRLVSCLSSLTAALVLAAPATANTLLWYRFGGDGATIENVANPGTMDGTLKGISGWWGAYFNDDSTKFPKRVDAFTNGVRVIDPKTDTLYPLGKALSWTGDQNNTGAVIVPGANLTSAFKEAKSFTYEAFVKFSQAAIDRATGGGNAMFPILHWGRDTSTASTQEGVIFSLWYNGGKLAPFFRLGYDKTDGTSGMQSGSAHGNCISATLDV